MNAHECLLFAQTSGLAVEFETGGRNFQISARNGMRGFWERFFPKPESGGHPTRREISAEEMNEHLSEAENFTIYRLHRDDGEILSRQQFMARLRG